MAPKHHLRWLYAELPTLASAVDCEVVVREPTGSKQVGQNLVSADPGTDHAANSGQEKGQEEP